jgi:membrane-associated phospholipid phosphatase
MGGTGEPRRSAPYRVAHRLADGIVGLSLRLTSCVLILIYFQVGYYWSYHAQSGPGILDAALPIDGWIPMVPGFIVFYMLGYLFVLVPCVLVRDRRAFYAATVIFCVMLSVAFLLFRYAPIHMDKTYAAGSDWFSRLAHFQQTKDTTYNNFPSLHVALNVYAYSLIAWQSRRISWWWLPLPVLIVSSTLLVKQHLFVDVIGGLLLAWGGFVGFRRLAAVSSRTVFLAWLVSQGLLLIVLATHSERLAKTGRKIARFLDAGGIDVGEAAIAVLAALVVAGLTQEIVGRVRGRRDASWRRDSGGSRDR